jgi:hypothetical protein
MTASKLTELALEYAQAMAREMTELNAEYTRPDPAGMTRREKENLKQYGVDRPNPTPEQLIPTFERLFCLTMAEYVVIVPDEEDPR